MNAKVCKEQYVLWTLDAEDISSFYRVLSRALLDVSPVTRSNPKCSKIFQYLYD